MRVVSATAGVLWVVYWLILVEQSCSWTVGRRRPVMVVLVVDVEAVGDSRLLALRLVVVLLARSLVSAGGAIGGDAGGDGVADDVTVSVLLVMPTM